MNLTGVTVGSRYTIEREIGHGGMATVWLASDHQHGRRVAIKTLHPELANAVGTDRFLREIRLTAGLQHPTILPILESGSIENDSIRIPWYAMPFLEGESLRQRLDRELQLPIDEALRIATAVGQALGAAHARNIVHRDIKPENVFLSGEHVYVVDFGVAKALSQSDAERLTSTGLTIGTPAYMSPEQALAGTIDARSDQYSLAVMLYEMLAGEPPFAGPNQQAVIARRLAEPARPLATVRATVPPAMERATLRALERTPADRYPSVTSFIRALSEDAPPSTTTARRPRKGLVIGLAAAAMLVVAAAAWASLRPRGPDPEAVALYQRAVQAYDRRSQAGVGQAITTLGSAIRLDSSYAPAWNLLAKAYVRAWQRGFQVDDLPPERLLPLAVEAVDQATRYAPRNAEAWQTKGVVTQQIDPTNVPAALRHVHHSLDLDASLASSWHFYAIMQANIGHLDSAVTAWRRTVELDPGYTQGLSFLALGHYWRGNYDSAAVWADSAIRVDDSYLLARQTASLIAVERGQFVVAEDQAAAALRMAEGVEYINSHANLAIVKARAGNASMARVNVLQAEVSRGVLQAIPLHTAVYMAEAYVAVGDVEKALSSLGSYATRRDMHFQLHIRCSPTFAPLAGDPRFRALLVIGRPAPGSHC